MVLQKKNHLYWDTNFSDKFYSDLELMNCGLKNIVAMFNVYGFNEYKVKYGVCTLLTYFWQVLRFKPGQELRTNLEKLFQTSCYIKTVHKLCFGSHIKPVVQTDHQRKFILK